MTTTRPGTAPKPGQRTAKQRRVYRSAVEKALFQLSRGRCYYPGCPEPTLRMIQGEPVVNVTICHICAHDENGPRSVRSMTLEQKRSFSNLILCCIVHSKVIDDTRNEGTFTIALLTKWKQDRESNCEGLAALDGLTDATFAADVVSAISAMRTETLDALGELAKINAEAANTLRSIIAEQFDRPYLDLDAIASLADSARVMRSIPDYALMLGGATKGLEYLEYNAITLKQATGPLVELEQRTFELDRARDRLADTTDNAVQSVESAIRLIGNSLREITPQLDSASETTRDILAQTATLPPYQPGDSWTARRNAFIAGAITSAVVILAIIIFIHVHHGGVAQRGSSARATPSVSATSR
jgi:hypothetical protein